MLYVTELEKENYEATENLTKARLKKVILNVITKFKIQRMKPSSCKSTLKDPLKAKITKIILTSEKKSMSQLPSIVLLVNPQTKQTFETIAITMLNLYLYTQISHLRKQALVYLQLVQYDFKSVKEYWVTIRCTVLLCLSAPENLQ